MLIKDKMSQNPSFNEIIEVVLSYIREKKFTTVVNVHKFHGEPVTEEGDYYTTETYYFVDGIVVSMPPQFDNKVDIEEVPWMDCVTIEYSNSQNSILSRINLSHPVSQEIESYLCNQYSRTEENFYAISSR